MKHFAYRIKNSNDRDCVAYIDTEKYKNEYVSRVGIDGSCYCCSFGRNLNKYDEQFVYNDVETILTEDEYNLLCNPNGADIKAIMLKLESEENQEFFENIVEEEIEYLKDEFSLDDSDIEQIFDNYYLEYKDRSIVCCIYDDTEDLGYNEMTNCYSVDSFIEQYIDYERFGNDLLDDSEYIELEDGRIVRLSY